MYIERNIWGVLALVTMIMSIAIILVATLVHMAINVTVVTICILITVVINVKGNHHRNIGNW